MSRKTIPYKCLSVFLTLIVFLVSIPIAFAVTPVELSSSNITSWPTATYVNGETMYFGQKIEDVVTLTGGTVEYNGAVVAGHFEFIEPSSVPTSTGNKRSDIKFVPDDTSAYIGFEAKRCRNVTYTVTPTTPVYVDKINNPLVATEVEAGALLSTSVLSGGTMTNPYNSEEPNVLAAKWIWSPSENEPSSTTVTESGYYTAQFVTAGYNLVTASVYVKIASAIPETSIAEYPTISELTYDPNVTWADVALEGGKAVIKGTETEVEGTFAIKDTRKDVVPNPNFTEIEVVFTPANAEEALSNEFTIPVKVNPAPLAFIDDEGNVVEDFTFEVDPGIKMSEVNNLIKANLRVPENSVIGVEDYYAFAENGRKYKLTVNHESSYYTGTELYFTIAFKETEIVPKLITVGEGRMKIDCGEYKPSGTFSVYYVVGETETKIGDYKGNSEEIIWSPDASGNYTFKVVYNRAEGDYFKIDSITTYPLDYYPKHNIVATGSIALGHSMGETVTITAPATDPEMLDKPYYGFAGWTDVKGNTGLSEEELANATVSFTMPDEEVELKANYKFSLKLFFEWILQQIIQFYTFIVTAVKDLFALATA